MQGHSVQSRVLARNHRIARITLVVLDAFTGLTALAGGIALLAGWMQLPATLLQTTPFSSYTIPALLLAIIVGGSALVATVMMLLDSRKAGVLASAVAGFILLVWIVTEVAMIGLGSWLQALYFVIAVVTVGLAAYEWWVNEIRPVA